MKETETIFKVGDQVFDIQRGWSVVRRVDYDKDYPILLENSSMYDSDGRRFQNDKTPALSFTEYTLEGFSQERPKEPLPFKVGDVVYLSSSIIENFWYTGKLQEIDRNAIEACYIGENLGRHSYLALENPLLNPDTRIYTIEDL